MCLMRFRFLSPYVPWDDSRPMSRLLLRWTSQGSVSIKIPFFQVYESYRLIGIMGIPWLVWRHLHVETVPGTIERHHMAKHQFKNNSSYNFNSKWKKKHASCFAKAGDDWKMINTTKLLPNRTTKRDKSYERQSIIVSLFHVPKSALYFAKYSSGTLHLHRRSLHAFYCYGLLKK